MTATLTYALFERDLAKRLRKVTYEVLPSMSDAARIYGEIRVGYGLSRNGWSTLTTEEAAIDKLSKGDGLPIMGLALAYATSARVNLCPHSGECEKGCVSTAGNGGFDHTQAVRKARTEFLRYYPLHFLALLVHEMDRWTVKYPDGFAARLNAYSDIRWERVLPGWFWKRYSKVAFYDYTKHPTSSRPVATLPTNYRLTYSYNERTTARELDRLRANMRNLAVVVSTRGGKVNGAYRPIPAEVLGFTTIDGDTHDRRYSDPQGVAVVLRRKGTLSDDSPFVVTV